MELNDVIGIDGVNGRVAAEIGLVIEVHQDGYAERNLAIGIDQLKMVEFTLRRHFVHNGWLDIQGQSSLF